MDDMKDYNENFSSFDDDPNDQFEDYFDRGGCTAISVCFIILVAISLVAGVLCLFT